MSKAIHKPRPEVPHWVYEYRDNCWFCQFSKNQRGCSNCKANKRFVAKEARKRDSKNSSKLGLSDY